MKNNLFESMENEVLHLMLRNRPSLLAQLKNATIISREFTGVGFYSNFYVENNMSNEGNVLLPNARGRVNNNVDVGFVLFVSGGKLSCLEGYTYDEPWPEIIESYKVF